jgi:hypothetical protein
LISWCCVDLFVTISRVCVGCARFQQGLVDFDPTVTHTPISTWPTRKCSIALLVEHFTALVRKNQTSWTRFDKFALCCFDINAGSPESRVINLDKAADLNGRPHPTCILRGTYLLSCLTQVPIRSER